MRRQSIWTRVSHWTWTVALVFLLMSGLQIFNFHPVLHVGEQSGFGFDNAVLRIGSEERDGELRGHAEVLGRRIDTTGVLGVSGGDMRGFPAWATVPSYLSLESARLIHFFFGWIFVAALLVWFVAGLIDGHLRRDILPSRADIRALPRDCLDHARLKFHHARTYNGLQKLSYATLMFGAMPLMTLTGLAMSPAMGALFPPLTALLGGRETARTIHFIMAGMLVLFVVVHVAMVLLHRPFNSLRSMVTGWCRDAE